MLFYTSATCNMIIWTSFPIISRTLTNPQTFDYKIAYFIVTSYVLAAVLGFLITAFFCFHIYLQCCQYTTIEFCEKRGKANDLNFHSRMPFNRGFCRNFKTTLGTNPLLWLVPICK
jgi:hypothetical protein